MHCSDEETANLTRAIQEDQILKVKLKLYKREGVVDLKSFWEVWNQSDGRLKAKILAASGMYIYINIYWNLISLIMC